MTKREQIYEGKAKKVYATEDEAYCIVSYKDDATAFNGLKKGSIAGRGHQQPDVQPDDADAGGP
jgi:phosphoribosylaminoimidazole-succinocarboxamide synthase